MRGGVRSAVGLDEADDDVGAALGAAVALAEHRVGLADPGGRTEVDPVTRRGSRSSVLPRQRVAGAVQAEVQQQHVDARLAEHPELRPSVASPPGVARRRRRCRARAPPGPPGVGVLRADVGVEPGGAGGDGVGGTSRGRAVALGRPPPDRSSIVRPASALSGPTLERGRGQRVVAGSPSRRAAGSSRRCPSKGWPTSSEPTTVPSSSTSEPSARSGKATCATPVTANG